MTVKIKKQQLNYALNANALCNWIVNYQNANNMDINCHELAKFIKKRIEERSEVEE